MPSMPARGNESGATSPCVDREKGYKGAATFVNRVSRSPTRAGFRRRLDGTSGRSRRAVTGKKVPGKDPLPTAHFLQPHRLAAAFCFTQRS